MTRRALLGVAGMVLLVAACGVPPTPTPVPTVFAPERAATPAPSPSPIAAAASPPWPTSTPMLLAPAPAREDTPAAWPLAAELASQVDRGRLMDDVNWLADDAQRGRQAGTADEDRVRDWLAQRVQALDLAPFAAIGLVGYTLPFTLPPEIHSGEPAIADNVIGLIPGAVYPDRYVTLSAHYDHLGTTADGQVFNGADDDATGVAAVLEAARILSGAATAPEETLVFVTFSAEEMGMLGADALCGRLEAAGLTASSQVLNLEVLGAIDGMGTYLDVWDEDDPRAEPLVQAVQTAGRLLGTRVDRQGLDPGSDARRLVGCGVQAISISVAWSLETHPCIHQPCDDPHLIDVDGFEAAVRVAVAAAWLLANDGR